MIRNTLTYNQLISQHLEILSGLQYGSGLFAASKKNVQTGYDKSWLRDNFYECLAFEIIEDWNVVLNTYSALLKIFLKHEEKIDWAIARKPEAKHEYIHARYNPETFEEFWDEWGNKQNDSIGAILFEIGRIETLKKNALINNENFFRIIQKLVNYLDSIQYWIDKDSGMWEENEEIHASSVGACLAGLKSIREINGIIVKNHLIIEGQNTLNKLLPRESDKKFVDLALLSLIYPYNIVNEEQKKEILENVEYHLLRKHGVIRYKNDYYYNKNEDGISEEAEWTFGLSWLAIIYSLANEKEKAQSYVEKMIAVCSDEGIPELFFSNSDKYNENTPLGWAESLFIIALHEINKKMLQK